MAKISHLRFVEVKIQGQVTSRYTVWSNGSDIPLGEIRYYAQWRKFCFYPLQDTLFDTDCLYELSVKLDDLAEMLKHRRP